jgi:hypothetical protein
MLTTFSQWLKRMDEAVLAKTVIGLGAGMSQGGGVGLRFQTPQGQEGTTSPIVRLRNLNIPDEQGRTQWEVKTQNSTYIAVMDMAAAQHLAKAWRAVQQYKQQTA